MTPTGRLGILDLLQLRGFAAPTRRFKLVRHQDVHLDLQDLLRRGWLDTYQAFQARPVFHDIDYVIAFIGVGRTEARLVGVYKVLEHEPGHPGLLPSGCPGQAWVCRCYYQMEKLPGFEDLEDRMVIEWGKGTRSWCQWPTNKEVVEILRSGQLVKPFNDYLEFTLTYGELQYLYAEPEANREWRARLTAVAGVYLVLATTSGAQYVGSAHGVEGFWGRRAAYAKDGHGGNVLLKKLISHNSAYPKAFSYSILQILPPTVARAEVLDREQLYKQKLGSRAIGLNAN